MTNDATRKHQKELIITIGSLIIVVICIGVVGFLLYYKYLLYLCGLILVLSLFLNVKGFDVNPIKRISFWVVVIVLGVWFLML